ncbi:MULTISPECIES: ACP S-malonyltransferase [Streptomyces]|uniref:ACP S-malonyltransferase n=1 Tax=Streptomyces TaxID=1883 RepID=UPI0007C83338|nr:MULTISPECIES: ACP S-malonyltransferase [Streptomyces]
MTDAEGVAVHAWLFPGQGSQRRGMGADVLGRFPDHVAAADGILGLSVADLCLRDPQGLLRDTGYAQPAMFVVEALTALAARVDGAAPPGVLAGHSLGEYAALFTAGCFDFETGVRLVQRRGELMARCTGGGMLAVVGLSLAEASEMLERYGAGAVDVANHNSGTQVVLAGPLDALGEVAARLKEERAARIVPLNVSAPFHSRYMRQAADGFADFVARFRLREPDTPVIANATARPYGPDVAGTLVRQITEPVQWARTMRHLLDLGTREVTEQGPGTVLTDLWRTARREHDAAGTASGAVPAASGGAPAVSGAAPVASGAAPALSSAARAASRAVPAASGAAPAPSGALPAAPAAAPPVSRSVGGAGSPEPMAREHPLVRFGAERLGSAEFRRDYGIRYAYLAGSMYQGISSTDLVLRMGRAGLLGFFGSGGLRTGEVDAALRLLARESGPDRRYGANLLHTPDDPAREEQLADLLLRHEVRFVEAAGFARITPALVRLRFSGAHRDRQGRPVAGRHVVAKVSRLEVAEAFAAPAPGALLDRLVANGRLTAQEADIARELPVSDDLCVEADSGGHTDGGAALTLFPTIARLREAAPAAHGRPWRIRVGAAGGLGTPEAVAAAFLMGADFVLTGSVNQCSPEAGTADEVKRLLARIGVQDTTYAPAGDMFELGARVQVVRKGTLFAARANKLYQLYRRHGSLEDLDEATRRSLEDQCFGRPLDEVWRETARYLAATRPDELARAEANPRHRMALVFRWYFVHSTRAALRGDPEERVNYQIHCGPAMGAFNRFVAGTELADWRRRHVDVIAQRLMTGATDVLTDRLRQLAGDDPSPTRENAAGSDGAQ